jgi:uncharacterized protein Smg (DUF494 family)
MCDGRQLARQLNRYGFTPSDLRAALAWAEVQLAEQQQAEQQTEQQGRREV